MATCYVAVQEPSGAFSVRWEGGGPLATPAGRGVVTLPTRALAEAVAEALRPPESPLGARWIQRARAGLPLPPPVPPLLPLVFTALDMSPEARAKKAHRLVHGLLAGGDVVCYRAPRPEDLARRQAVLCDSLLEWCANALGSRLNATEGVMPRAQPPEALDALGRVIGAYDAFRFVALADVAEATGSLVLAVALSECFRDVDGVMEVATLEDADRALGVGEDPFLAARRASLREDITLAAKWFALLTEESAS